MTILLDTNIITRGAQPGHPMYPAALNSVEILTKRGESLLLCSQNLYAFWSVATRPAGENGLGLTVARAHGELQSIQTIFRFCQKVMPFFRSGSAWSRNMRLREEGRMMRVWSPR